MASVSDEFYRIQKLPPYVFAVINEMKAKARAAQLDVVDLGMGNPDGATPEPIVKKLIEAVRNPRNHRYSLSRGIPRLRAEIVKRYRTKYGVELDSETEAIVTIGAKDALAHLLFAVIGPGDAVVSPNPAYPIHQYGVIMAEGHACMLPMPDAGRVPEPPGASVQDVVAQAADDPDFVSAQSDHAVRGSAVLPRYRGAGGAARHHDRARFRVCRHLGFDGYRAAQHSASGRRQGNRRRDLFHVEELQHGGLARGILPGESRR